MFKTVMNFMNDLRDKVENHLVDRMMKDWNREPSLKDKKEIAMSYCKEIMDEDPKFGVYKARSVYKDYVGEEAPF